MWGTYLRTLGAFQSFIVFKADSCTLHETDDKRKSLAFRPKNAKTLLCNLSKGTLTAPIDM